MRIKPRFLIGGGLIVAAIAYLIVVGIRSTSEYYLTVSEAAAQQSQLMGQSVRVAGRVKPGSASWDPISLTLSFALMPIGKGGDLNPGPIEKVAAPGTEDASFKVICKGQPKPDMFADGRDVIVEGRLEPDHFIAASQVLTSCPSKYAPKKPS